MWAWCNKDKKPPTTGSLVVELLNYFHDLNVKVNKIMSTQEQAASDLVVINDKLIAINEQLKVVGTEVSTAAAAQAKAIEDLKAELAAAATNPASPSLQAAIDAVTQSTTALAMAAQVLDDMNQPAPAPVV
jgi:hypothetical protein